MSDERMPRERLHGERRLHDERRRSERLRPEPEAAARPVAGETRAGRPNPLQAWGRLREEAGAATAEYVVATMAAVGFAGLLIVILRGDAVRSMLTDLVRNALTVG
jgi:hypothetical protein